MPASVVTLLPYALATFDDAVAYAKIGTAPTQDEAEMLRRMVNAATRRVEGFTGRTFMSRTHDNYHDGSGGRRLFLRQAPVLAVQTFEQLSLDGSVAQTYSAGDYQLDTQHGALSFSSGGGFHSGVRRWHVVFTASYATLAAVPDDIILACLQLVARYWRDYSLKRDDIESQGVDGQSITFERGPLPSRIKGLLKAYRMPPSGSL